MAFLNYEKFPFKRKIRKDYHSSIPFNSSIYYRFQARPKHSLIMSSLLDPVVVGGKLLLRNRVVMGSMTRNRCVEDFKPGPAQVKHYADRARDGVGLIVNEGTFVDWTGCDWDKSPVMINEEHARAWRSVTDAVHRDGGKIYFQAWHAGTQTHCSPKH